VDHNTSPRPRRESAIVLHDSSWCRDAIVSPGATAPGHNGHFALTLRAGQPGEHVQTWFVQESTAWFADSAARRIRQLGKVTVSRRDHAASSSRRFPARR